MKIPDMGPHVSTGRSLGLKFILVCFLVLLMSVPAMFISYISYERSGRATEVTREVAKRYGGEQYVTGPVLAVPYHVKNNHGEIIEEGDWVIFPDEGRADFKSVDVTIRKRSLFKVPTYMAQGELISDFTPITTETTTGRKELLWDKAEFIVAITDGRGLSEDIYLYSNGIKRKFMPTRYDHAVGHDAVDAAYHKDSRRYNGYTDQGGATFLSVPAQGIVSETQPFSVRASVRIGGATKLSLYPHARSGQYSVTSDWPNPGFEGAFAPVEREITDTGFTARWSVPYLARGIPGEGPAHRLDLFRPDQTALSVRFVAKVNPYQTVNRALKYAVMFIGLVFIAYFLFEVLVGARVHPAQYLMIGLAQSIFYLLLLAFSEHIGFAAAFLLAACATVAVTAGYAGAVLGDRRYILRSGIVFAAVYALLYSLMRMQDFALMIGALASFMAVALMMYLTRNVDWYGGRNRSDTPHQT